MLQKDWPTFLGITFMYAVGVFIFVKSFSIGTMSETTASGGILSVVNHFGTMLSSASNSFSAASGIYQIIVSTICSLALIWYFRQILSDEKATAKQSFYQGMRPLVPYLLVLTMLGVHLIPIAIGGYLLSLMQSSYMIFGWEMVVAWFVFGLLAIWSMRLLTHSLFALIAVTLPDMTPLRALRGAKKMVYKRRLALWRKLLVAVIYVGLVGFILMVPFMLMLPAVAPWAFFLFTVSVTMFGQAFVYTVYREIL